MVLHRYSLDSLKCQIQLKLYHIFCAPLVESCLFQMLLFACTYRMLHLEPQKLLQVELNMTLLTVQTVHISLLKARYLQLLLVGIHISYMTQPFFRYDTTLTAIQLGRKICGDNKIRSLLRLPISGTSIFLKSHQMAPQDDKCYT